MTTAIYHPTPGSGEEVERYQTPAARLDVFAWTDAGEGTGLGKGNPMAEVTHRLRGLTLTLTERCNLRCSYCYVPVTRGRQMDQATANHALDWFLANAASEGDLNLSFFGGEPFLAAVAARRAVDRVRASMPAGRFVRVSVPSNALAMTPTDISWCRRERIDLAISVDGGPGTPGRCFADGSPCAGSIMDKAREILRGLPSGSVTARMTVTPENVGSLCANIWGLAETGFSRIAYSADSTAAWSEAALSIWQREHERLVNRFVEARSAGKQIPSLPAWEAIEARLVGRSARRRCGAGVDHVAIAPEGGIFPCYRFVYAKDGKAWQLGHVEQGITEENKVEQLARLEPDGLRPDRGGCQSCSAADGCPHFCPALGFLARGDIERVPETACRLLTIQVAAVRERCARFRPSRPKPAAPSSPWATAAMVAVAVTSMASCGTKHVQAGPDAALPVDTHVADAMTGRDAVPPDAAAAEAKREASQPLDSDDEAGPIPPEFPPYAGYCL